MALPACLGVLVLGPCLLLTVVVAGAVAVIAIGRVVVAAIAGPVALVPVAAVALIPTLTLTCGGEQGTGPFSERRSDGSDPALGGEDCGCSGGIG